MTDELIEGYASYASAEEIQAAGQAPATPVTVALSIAGSALSGASMPASASARASSTPADTSTRGPVNRGAAVA
ncbi:LxmA leader domain family RiPP [Streptomyces lasalocidi]